MIDKLLESVCELINSSDIVSSLTGGLWHGALGSTMLQRFPHAGLSVSDTTLVEADTSGLRIFNCLLTVQARAETRGVLTGDKISESIARLISDLVVATAPWNVTDKIRVTRVELIGTRLTELEQHSPSGLPVWESEHSVLVAVNRTA